MNVKDRIATVTYDCLARTESLSQVPKRLAEIKQELAKEIGQGSIDVIVARIIECRYRKESFDLLDQHLYDLRQLSPKIKIFFVCNSWYDGFLTGHLQQIHDILYVDYSLLSTYYRLIKETQSPLVSNWNSANTKILLLLGKAYKLHRIGLLYKLLKSELRSTLDYSFRIAPGYEEICRGLVNTSDQEYAWLCTQQRNIDAYFPLDREQLGIMVGYPYDAAIYDTALFEIVSEGEFNRLAQKPMISEKTWISILNRRPFILVGEVQSLDYLEDAGFHTFREFLAIPNYDNPDAPKFLDHGPQSEKSGSLITVAQKKHWLDFYAGLRHHTWPLTTEIDELPGLPDNIRLEIERLYVPSIESLDDMRLDAVVENAVFWKTNIVKFKGEISAMLDKNFERFLTLGSHNLDKFKNFFARHNLDYSVLSYLQHPSW